MVVTAPDAEVPPPHDGYRLQHLLVGYGVAQMPGGTPTPWLEELSGGRVGRESWRRFANKGDLPKITALPAMADALLAAGINTSVAILQTALLADLAARKGHEAVHSARQEQQEVVHSFRADPLQSGESAADSFLSMLRGLPDETQREKFIERLSADMTPTERAALILGMVTPPEVGGNASKRRRKRTDG
jgi:hypothetical protein